MSAAPGLTGPCCARSLGFGGAFVALADDATAAFANPAGLVQLARPELSIEGRYWSYSTPFSAGGRLAGEPTGIGLDDTAGLRTAKSERDLSGVSFLSAVYPVKSGSIALYRHQLAKFESLAVTDGLFQEIPGFQTRFPDLRTATDLDVVTYGFAAGFRLSETFSWGFGLAYNEVGFEARTEVFDSEDNGAFFAPNPFSPEMLNRVFTLSDDGSDWTANAGTPTTGSTSAATGAIPSTARSSSPATTRSTSLPASAWPSTASSSTSPSTSRTWSTQLPCRRSTTSEATARTGRIRRLRNERTGDARDPC